MKDDLPDMNANGFVTLSDFYAHQHQTIETALTNAQIPHLIEFYAYRNGDFRVYVDPKYVESARELCNAIEFGPVF
jgi:hypothetical protein